MAGRKRMNSSITGFLRGNRALRTVLLKPAQLAVARYTDRRDRAIRDLVGRLSAMLVDDPVVKVAEFDGTFALSPRSHIFRRIATEGHYEPVLTARCRELLDPDRDVIDVGANVGFHTIMLAKLLRRGRLLAVEPTLNALSRLRRNIEMNGVGGKVTVFEGVASNAAGELEIKTLEGLEEYSTLGAMAHPSVSQQTYTVQRVAARTVDQLAEENGLDVGFMKVDVEGAEHLVFGGAGETLARCRPVVLSELSDTLLRKNGSSSAAVVRIFEDLGYRVVDPLHPGVKPGNIEFGDILCIPGEHPAARTS